MATTTYSSTNPNARTNPAVYWAIGAAIVLAIIAFLAMRGDDEARVTPATSTDSGAVTAPVDSNTSGTNFGTAPAANTNNMDTNTNTNMNGGAAGAAGSTGMDAKSGSSMNTDTQQNSNNSNTGGEPSTQPVRKDQ